MGLEDLLSSQSEADNLIDASEPLKRPGIIANGLLELAGSDAESDNENTSVQIPRNQLIARLQPRLSDDDESESDEDDLDERQDKQDGLDAYARLKKELSSRIDPKQRAETAQPVSVPNEQSSSDEDEDDMPVRTSNIRRLAPRKEKSISPRSSPPPRQQSRQPSPGLFVSPHTSPTKTVARGSSAVNSDSDEPSKHTNSKTLEERVKRIRAERKANQQKEEERRQRNNQKDQKQDTESDSDPDGENGRRLTQQARPTRKAGKKALLEMAREQQRISRNMQLTHQAKTKKRYGTKDLFSKLGFVQVDNEILPAPTSLLTPDTSSITASSDAEGNQSHDTPPTSPPSQDDTVDKDVIMIGMDMAYANVDVPDGHVVPFPSASRPTSPLPARMDKGKGRAPEFQHLPTNSLLTQARVSLPPAVPKAVSKPIRPAKTDMIELSDSEEERTVPRPKSRFPVFDRMPEKKKHESTSLLHLRHLAHLTSPEHRGSKGKPSINVAQLQFSLAQKARQQAQKAREEKIEDLKRRGIHVETEEEREKHQLEIEDMVVQLEKARQEDLKLRKLERDEAKKNGEKGDGLVSSDESDDDYIGSGEEAAADFDEMAEEEDDVELSGSEEDDLDADVEDELDEEEAAQRPNGMFDDEADEDDHEGVDRDEAMDHVEEADEDAPPRAHVVKRRRQVVIDDEDDSESESQKQARPLQEPQQDATQDDGMAAAFGFNNTGTTLGLTQMFAGTMANIGSDSRNAHPLDKEPDQDSIDFLRSIPDTQPGVMFSATPDVLVPNSQAQTTQQDGSQVSRFDFGISQLIETSPAFSRTQLSQLPEPTQDAGLELSRSPAGLAPPPSTIETVMMPIAESPVVKRKGRLQRRTVAEDEGSEAAQDELASVYGSEGDAAAREAKNAFTVMNTAAKKKAAVDNFNKETSWAKDIVVEQAEESEDEYAGIGGASDDDSGEEDEEMKKMIDSQDVKVDERKLAAFWAEKDKARDEKQINQLYKDIMSGGLRRRRGGDGFDMSDSEDEAEQRRRKKQQGFRQMTKALLADEKVGKLAENPKSAAFFKAIADHEDDPDYDFMDAPGMDLDMETSQSQANELQASQEGNEDVIVPDSQTADANSAPFNPLKRKSSDSQDKENRPPPNMRRTAPSDNLVRKPMTFADVQHSISELVEDPRMIIPDSQVSDSDSELEITDAPAKPARKPVIDRLTLSRTSTSSQSSLAAGNLAFHAPTSGAYQPGFKVPSLIRRATSNLSAASSTTNSGASTPTEGSVRRGGTGKSNIHAQAREAERRALLEKSDKRKRDTLKKMVGKARGKRSILGGLDGGFE